MSPQSGQSADLATRLGKLQAAADFAREHIEQSIALAQSRLRQRSLRELERDALQAQINAASRVLAVLARNDIRGPSEEAEK